jgi:hypothetical protein
MTLRARLAVVYASGSVSHTRQAKGDDPDKKRYPGPPGCRLGMRLTTPTRKKRQREREIQNLKKTEAMAHPGL